MIYTIQLQTLNRGALRLRYRFIGLSLGVLFLAAVVYWLTRPATNIRIATSVLIFGHEASGIIGLQALGYLIINGVAIIGHHTLLPKLLEHQRTQKPPKDEVEALAQRLFAFQPVQPPTKHSSLALIHLLGMFALHGGIVASAVQAYESYSYSPFAVTLGYVMMSVIGVATWVYALRIALRLNN